MDGPTLDQTRAVKTEIVRQFQGIKEFAGAGIGESNGRYTVRVNWRVLPKNLTLPSSVGGVEINHYEVDVAPGNRTGLLYLREPVVAADTNFNRGVSLEEFRQAALLRFQALDFAHQGRLTLAGLEAMPRAAAPREKQEDAPTDVDPHAMDPQQH